MQEYDNITITFQLEKNLSNSERTNILIDIISEFNDRFINVIDIKRNEKQIFHYKEGFNKKELI